MNPTAAPPLMETKLRPPDRRAASVPRAELVARLALAVEAHRLTLVSAAAGWGKTTLVGDWLAGASQPTAWVALEPADNDPARFWRYLVEAVRRVGVEVDGQTLGALAGDGDTREAGLSELLNAIDAAPERAVVALDDYHAITEGCIHESIAFLVDRMPETLALVMTTRTDPPIGVARLRARGHLAEIRSADLRFSDAEAEALLNGGVGLGLGLAPDEVGQLRARTEGWAAGLYLAGLSLRGRGDAADFIREFAGDDRLVVDYLADEVLGRQPEGRRRFLLRTSVLTRLSGPLCDAVAGTTGSAQVLSEMEGSNLFLVPLDNRREWYRYHHLFGELLRHELALAAPDEIAQLHRRAADWHLSAGDVDEAVHHRVASGDLDAAADLIARHWAGYHRHGWTVTTERWLDLLPRERVLADPRLCMARALIGINLGRPGDAAPWLDAAEAATAAPGAPGDPGESAASLAAGRSLERLLAGDGPAAVEIGRRALEMTDGQATWWRSVACLALGIALHAADRLDEAYPILDEAVAVGRVSDAWAPVVVSLSHLANTDLARGDLARAEARVREAIALAEDERHSEYPHAAGAHAGLGRILAERGDMAGALEQSERGVQLALRGRSGPETAHAVIQRAAVLAAAGDRDGARECADRARGLLEGATGAVQLTRLLAELDEQAGGRDRGPAPAAGELSERELAVLRRLTGEGSAREIAADLFVSHNTVKTQLRSIYRKLGVATRDEAVARARERGILPRPLARGGG